MGRKLEPDNPMYGGFRSMEDTGSATVQTTAFNAMMEPAPAAPASALDFDFDAGAPAARTGASQGETMILPGAEQDSSMDFDITSTNPTISESAGSTAMPDMNDMIFDVTGSHSSPAAEQPEAAKPADDGGMAFTLDFPVDEAAAKPRAFSTSCRYRFSGYQPELRRCSRLSRVNLLRERQGDQWQEVSTKLDLAKAYQEMGDNDGAREILEEVLREGDATQREAAQAIFDQLI